MQPSFYVSISGQVSLERRLETVANNFANVNTGGYRASDVKFDTIVDNLIPDPVAFANARGTYISRAPGALVRTDENLDFGIQGDAWFGIQTPNGTAYTRDGRFKMIESGELMTIDGYPVLDPGGGPVVLDPKGGAVQVAQNGAITQNNRRIGAIGLFKIPDDAPLSRFENSAVVPQQPAEPVVDFTTDGMFQGFAEQSNVNPILTMTRLISVQRTFEAITNALAGSETSLSDAIKTLGSTS
jgi:flagellar basal-body rod protein FlgF